MDKMHTDRVTRTVPPPLSMAACMKQSPEISPGILPTSPAATFSMVKLPRSVSRRRLSHEYSFLPGSIMGGVEAADVEPNRMERHRELRHDCRAPILQLVD